MAATVAGSQRICGSGNGRRAGHGASAADRAAGPVERPTRRVHARALTSAISPCARHGSPPRSRVGFSGIQAFTAACGKPAPRRSRGTALELAARDRAPRRVLDEDRAASRCPDARACAEERPRSAGGRLSENLGRIKARSTARADTAARSRASARRPVQGIPSTSSTSRGSSVVLVCASFPCAPALSGPATRRRRESGCSHQAAPGRHLHDMRVRRPPRQASTAAMYVPPRVRGACPTANTPAWTRCSRPAATRLPTASTQSSASSCTRAITPRCAVANRAIARFSGHSGEKRPLCRRFSS